MLTVHPYLQTVGQRLWEAALATGSILGTLVVPIAVCCVTLYALASWQTRRLGQTFGWHGLLLTGWLGTPVHELSHALAALVFMHKLDEVTLFEPRKGTGQLGRVRHSYNPKNPYAAILGNAFIPLAPFFGGAAVIYLATVLLMPELVPGKGLPEGTPVTASALAEPSSYQALAKRSWEHLVQLKDAVKAGQSWQKWQFYAYIYLIFCIGTHLAPSASDFESFRTPALLLILLIFVANLVVRFFGDLPRMATEFLWGPVVAMTGLLSFTMALCLVGAVVTTALTAALNLFRK